METQESLVKKLLGLLKPCEVSGFRKRRHGVNYDGGYVIIDGLNYDALYGYGVEIFEDDFPGLKEEYAYQKTLCQIDPSRRNPLEKFEL